MAQSITNNSSTKTSWKQIKLLPSTYSRSETYLLLVLITILLLATGTLITRWYFNNTKPIPKTGGEYTEGVVGSPKYVNPILAPLNEVDLNITKLAFAGLFKNYNQEIIPDLVATYSTSADGKKYQFTLKPNLLWSDNQPLTSADVVYTIKAIQDSQTKSPLNGGLRGVKATADNDWSFTLDLPAINTSFINNLTFGILPAHIWQNIQPANFILADYNLKPIGSGPYQFYEFTKNKQGEIRSYSLIINPYYYGVRPYLQKITFKFYPDAISALQALHDGSIDSLPAVPRTSLDEINDRLYNLYFLNSSQYTAIFYNPEKNNILKDKAVRQALTLAVDKKNIIEQVLQGHGVPAYGPLPPYLLGYNDKIKKYAFNLQQANDLLDKAGWKKSDDGIRQKDKIKLAITLTSSDKDEYLAVANLIKDSWQKIGVETNLNTVSRYDLIASVINSRDYQALLTAELYGNDSDPYPFWHSSQNQAPGLSLSIYIDQDMDKALEQARTSLNPIDRVVKLADFQALAAEQAYALFLYSPNYILALDKQIRGFDLNYVALPPDRFANISQWYLQEKRDWK